MKTTTTTALRLLAVLFIFCLFAPIAAGQGAPTTPTNWEDQIGDVNSIKNDKGGNGSDWDKAILIASAEELAYFAQQVNKGEAIVLGSGGSIGPGNNNFEGYYFALSADIDLKDHYWTPIGTGSNPFKGNFDGQGHCVSGLKVDVNGNVYAGLFGDTYVGTIQNLGVCVAKEGIRGAANQGTIYAGGIAGRAQNVHNCYVVGEGSIEITGGNDGYDGYAGGIVGSLLSNGSLTNCYATVDIRIENNGSRYAGGIVGRCSSTISCTYATGDVEAGTGDKYFYTGGICGYLGFSGTIQNSLALNGRIAGGSGFSNRIVGENHSNASLTANYASPEIVVNGKTVSGEDEGDKNGDPNVNLDNFDTVLNWGDGWDISDNTQLPKLKMRKGDGPNYADWPIGEGFTPQSPPDATLYLIAGSIANVGGGNGTNGSPILIANRVELAYFAKQVNKGEAIVLGSGGGPIEPNGKDNEGGFKGYYFALSADIDLSAYYWTPIGTDTKPFKGNFDGQGHCVSGLKVNGSVEYAGLFGYAAEGTLRNIGVHLAEEGILATSCAGGIAGQAANINNCYVVGVKDEKGNGAVQAEGASSTYAGGIVGRLTNTLKNCYATVDVIATGTGGKAAGTGEKSFAGGIAAQLESQNCSLSYTYATGAVKASGKSENYAGGICGDAGAGKLIRNLALNTSIDGSEGKSHRIVGNKEGNLFNNYASTKITLINSSENTDKRLNGTDTWSETFWYDLTFVQSYEKKNEWSKAWVLEEDNFQYLPKLKIVIGNDNDFSYDGVLTGQSKIVAMLESSAGFPFRWTSDYTTYLAYDGIQWLRSINDEEDPKIPFNGRVNGFGDCSLIISNSTGLRVSPSVPTLVFDNVQIKSEEKAEAFLTVNEGVEVILEMENDCYMVNYTNTPVIDNAGTLTIKAENLSDFLAISANDYAINNSGTLTLEGNGIILVGKESAINNDVRANVSANVNYNSPMVEWQFASGLGNKSIFWYNDLIGFGSGFDNCKSFATTYVPSNGEAFILKIEPRDGSPLIPQQGRDINNNYTGSFTANGKQLTVYTDVKDYPRLHLKQPAGGTLTVTDAEGSPLSDGDYVAPGTQLTLSCSSEANYDFVSYQSGPAANNLSALSGNQVTIGDADIWLSANLRYYDSTPPTPIYYNVYLPQVEGATTDPGPGEHEVESWDTFRFYLTIDSAYSESQPVVTTDRGETLVPRSSDGAYLVKYVRTDVEVFIDGIVQNPPPVANEAIGTDALVPQIWAEGTMLCIRMAEALPSAPVRIFTVDGRLYDSFASTPGLNRRQLPTGVYIVRIGEAASKVLIR